MLAVYRKEMRSYLTSMIGYVFIAFFLVIISLYFAYLNLNLASPNFEAVLQSIQFACIIFVPILTMRVLAEEKKQKTDQLLLTLPIDIKDIVIGKYLAIVTLYAVPMIIVCFYPLILSMYGMVNMAVAYMSIISFFLLGCANIAIGVFISSLTENPVIAAVVSFGALLVCFLMKDISNMVPHTAIASLIAFELIIGLLVLLLYKLTKNSTLALSIFAAGAAVLFIIYFVKRVWLEGLLQKVLSCFYMTGRLGSFFEGVFDIRGIVYFSFIIAVALFLTVQSMQAGRWKNGSYNMILTVIVVSISVLVNLIVNGLPAYLTQIDCSTSKLYTLSSTTKEYISNLNEQVSLYYICEGGKEDDNLVKLLDRYEDSGEAIILSQVDPALYPRFTSQFTDEIVENNSVIVVSNEKSKVVKAEDMYLQGFSYASYSNVRIGFDAEGMITSAINYVTSQNSPIIYVLNGNSELSLSQDFIDVIEKSNIDLQDLNLLSADSIPKDATAILISSPKKDYTKDEVLKIINYLEQGGKAIIFSDYSANAMPGFESILNDYGLMKDAGIILEGDSNRYMGYQYSILPIVQYQEITANLYQDTYVVAPMAQAIAPYKTKRNSIKITPLLKTSESSYIKEDVQNMTTSEKEVLDVEGPFVIAALIQEDIDNNKTVDTEIVYFSSGYILDKEYNDSVSGANATLLGNAASYLCHAGEISAAVPVKSMQVSSLLIPDFAANMWTVITVFIIPAAFLITGCLIWAKRRKR